MAEALELTKIDQLSKPKRKRGDESEKDRIVDARSVNRTPATDILDRIRKSKGVTHMSQVTITPDMALDLLVLNYANRTIRLSDLKKLSNVIANDKWVYDANAVKIAAKGLIEYDEKTTYVEEGDESGKQKVKIERKRIEDFELFDGQKRLLSCVLTNKPIVADIVVGLERKAKFIADTNVGRTLSDTTRMMGFKDWTNLSACIRNIYYYEKFQRFPPNIDKGESMDNGQMVEWLENKRRAALLEELLRTCNMIYERGAFLTKSEWATLYYLLYKQDPVFGKYFIEKLCDGNNLDTDGKKKDANIYRVRTLLMRWDRDRLKGVKMKMPRKMSLMDYKFRYLIRAFNASRDNQRLDDRFKVDVEDRKLEKLH